MRWLKRISIGIIVLLVVVGSGRLVQLWMDQYYHGERAPYLQMLSSDGVTLRWQSAVAKRYSVSYGESPQQLSQHIQEEQAGEQHEIRITGLKPASRYYYAIHDERGVVYAGEDYAFVTAPLTGTAQSVRFLVLGDPGYASESQARVKQQVEKWLQQHPRPQRAALDFVLTTGDNAYRSGSNQQFQDNFFVPYANWWSQYTSWPLYGNHDARRWAFFDIFSFPQQGESGGLASGTEYYYSFDYANLHVLMLDSEASNRDVDGKMMQWMQEDLKATRQKWLLALMHHPPYSKGTHNSDNRRDSGGRMQDMRERFVPVLEDFGVDLVLSGHSHMYQRSHLINCHYADSANLSPEMILSKSENSHYAKSGTALAAHQGTVYAVVGSSAKLDQGELDHPVMKTNLFEKGAMLVEIEGDKLSALFINEQGQISDQFSISKNQADGVHSQACQ